MKINFYECENIFGEKYMFEIHDYCRRKYGNITFLFDKCIEIDCRGDIRETIIPTYSFIIGKERNTWNTGMNDKELIDSLVKDNHLERTFAEQMIAFIYEKMGNSKDEYWDKFGINELRELQSKEILEVLNVLGV